MAKIFCNTELDLSQENPWTAQNGKTRRTLVLINKLVGQNLCTNSFVAKIGTLDKGNHSFIFLNHQTNYDKRILGLYLNKTYGYSVHSGKELYSAKSIGGGGNCQSMMGIYTLGTVLEVHSYKFRQSPTYVKLTETGWVEVSPTELFENEIKEV